MTFMEWMRENKDFTGSIFDMQSEYSASECDRLYEEYLKEGYKECS